MQTRRMQDVLVYFPYLCVPYASLWHIMHKLHLFQPLMVSDWMKCNSSCPSIERTESAGWQSKTSEPDTCATYRKSLEAKS